MAIVYKVVTTLQLRKILALYLIGVGTTMILIWIVFFATGLTSRLNMAITTLTTHVLAETIAGLLAGFGGVLLLKDRKYAAQFTFLGEGALFYAILNVIGYYIDIQLIWLVSILVPALIFHVIIIGLSYKILK